MSPLPSNSYAIGQAVFIRTDTLDYAEETIPFRNLEELVHVCTAPKPNLILDKVVVFSMVDAEPSVVTLGFVSSTRGQRPNSLDIAKS